MNRIIIERSNIHEFLTSLFFASVVFLFLPVNSKAQIRDAVAVDTISADSVSARKHTPRQAVIYSLIFPGLGQIYNKKYWKIPFIYGAGGTFLYYINYNQLKYKKFREALFDQATTKESVEIDGYLYPYANLEQGRDYYRRYRDLSVAGLAAIYLLNVIDAMVDAHFFNYDISDDLSMKVEPAVMQNIGLVGPTASVGFRINIGF
jgi:hypothetical protein